MVLQAVWSLASRWAELEKAKRAFFSVWLVLKRSGEMSRPKAIGNILADLMARRGYAREISAARSDEAWRLAVGELLAKHSRSAQVRRGVLEVIVANSTVLQELTFQKPELVAKLAKLAPDDQIRDVRFRIGPVDATRNP